MSGVVKIVTSLLCGAVLAFLLLLGLVLCRGLAGTFIYSGF